MSIPTTLPLWKRVSSLPMGRRVFSYLIRFVNPYRGKLGAQVAAFEKGYAEIILEDKNIRGIVSHISVDFIKKARGRLGAVSRCDLPDIKGDTEFNVFAEIFDAEDELVARVDERWKLGLKR